MTQEKTAAANHKTILRLKQMIQNTTNTWGNGEDAPEWVKADLAKYKANIKELMHENTNAKPLEERLRVWEENLERAQAKEQEAQKPILKANAELRLAEDQIASKPTLIWRSYVKSRPKNKHRKEVLAWTSRQQ